MSKTQKLIVSLLLLLLSSVLLASLLASAKSVRSQTNHVVISEIQIAGTVADDEFIELYNPTGNPVDLSTWSIQRETTSGTFAKKNFEIGDSIPAHGYFLISHTSYTFSTIPADMTHSSFSLSGGGGTVFLVNDQVLLTAGDETTIVDKVAFGSAALDPETSAFDPVPAAGDSIERKANADSTSITMADGDSYLGNGYDSNNNSGDFVTRGAPEPQNISSSHEPPEPTPTIPATPPVTGPTESPSPTPTELPSPTPTVLPTPTEIPSPTPTDQLTPTPTEIPSPTPTVIPTPTISPSPTPQRLFLGTLGFGGKQKICYLSFQTQRLGFLPFVFPQIICSR